MLALFFLAFVTTSLDVAFTKADAWYARLNPDTQETILDYVDQVRLDKPAAVQVRLLGDALTYTYMIKPDPRSVKLIQAIVLRFALRRAEARATELARAAEEEEKKMLARAVAFYVEGERLLEELVDELGEVKPYELRFYVPPL